MLASKDVFINGRHRHIQGLNEDDSYFRGIVDNFEQDYCNFCSEVLRPDYTCWDIGANIGVTSIIAADYCHTGRVFAFDGGSQLNCLHRENLRLNAVTNVEVIDAVVGSSKGSVRFTENSAYGYVSSLGQTEVAMLSPADIVSMTGYEPDYVKIDVEGHEPFILRSGLEMFKNRGTIIHFELNSLVLVAQHHQPLDLLEFVISSFKCVYVRMPGTGQIKSIDAMGGPVMTILHNMTQQPYQFLDDIVVTTDPSRLPGTWQ